jgi:hypothetical protein
VLLVENWQRKAVKILHMKQKPTHVEDIGVQALTFIAQDEERLLRFLQLTGLTPQTLRQAVKEPGFFEGVLSHITGYEPLLLEFSQWGGYRPEDVAGLTRGKE